VEIASTISWSTFTTPHWAHENARGLSRASFERRHGERQRRRRGGGAAAADARDVSLSLHAV